MFAGLDWGAGVARGSAYDTRVRGQRGRLPPALDCAGSGPLEEPLAWHSGPRKAESQAAGAEGSPLGVYAVTRPEAAPNWNDWIPSLLCVGPNQFMGFGGEEPTAQSILEGA